MAAPGHPLCAVAEVEGLCIVHKGPSGAELRPIVVSEILDAVEGPAEVMR